MTEFILITNSLLVVMAGATSLKMYFSDTGETKMLIGGLIFCVLGFAGLVCSIKGKVD